MDDITIIAIPIIHLDWSPWVRWSDLALPGSAVAPPRQRGVYEAKHATDEERLTIGKASNLYRRIIGGLVSGRMPHSAGKRIRAVEDLTTIVIRWAVTDRPAAVEEELHRIYCSVFGHLPRHTKQT